MTGPESADGRQHLHGWPIHNYDELVAKLAASRQSQGVTYDEMARRMGDCYLQQVFNWLNGVEPRAHRIFALAAALGYDLALVPRDEQHTPDVDYLRGVRETLALIRRMLGGDAIQPVGDTMLRAAAAELGLDEEEKP